MPKERRVAKIREMIKIILRSFGKSFSEELGINLKSSSSEEIFKWFLASILFGARISETIAKNTYKTFEKYGLLTPQKILQAGLGFLINPIMREGGYVRYDGVTSRKILGICKKLIEEYEGDVNNIYKKANPSFSKFVKLAAGNLGIQDIKGYWQRNEVKHYSFVQFEASLLRLGKDFCYKKRCQKCLVKKYCKISH